MFAIKSLHQVTRAEITALAHAAAERGEPVAEANPFMRGSANWSAFNLDYFERRLALGEPA